MLDCDRDYDPDDLKVLHMSTIRVSTIIFSYVRLKSFNQCVNTFAEYSVLCMQKVWTSMLC